MFDKDVNLKVKTATVDFLCPPFIVNKFFTDFVPVYTYMGYMVFGVEDPSPQVEVFSTH